MAGDEPADACFPASQILMITPPFHAVCEWFAAAWSAAQSFKNGSILTFFREGTLILGNSDLWCCCWNWPSSDKPHQIAFLMYSWPLLLLYPLSISPIPLKVSSSAVGQSSRTALQLLHCLPASHPWLLRLSPLPPCPNHIFNTLMIPTVFLKLCRG